MTSVSTWSAVALGGALGALARGSLDSGILQGLTPNLWVTLLVNIGGAAALGFAVGHGLGFLSPALRSGVTTGFLGSFTTFSGILASALLVTMSGELLLAAAYVLATFVVGAAAAFGGIEAGRAWSAMTAKNGDGHG